MLVAIALLCRDHYIEQFHDIEVIASIQVNIAIVCV